MKLELHRFSDIGDREASAWRELCGRALQPNPFFEPRLALAHAEMLGLSERVALAVLRRGNEWVACLPVQNVRRWHRCPIPMIATWSGLRYFSLSGTPIVAADRSEAAVEGLIAGMLSRPDGRLYGLDWIDEDGAVLDLIREATPRFGGAEIEFESFQRAALRKRPQATYLDGALNSKRRGELRRQRRRLQEHLGQELTVEDQNGEVDLIGQLIELEAKSRLAGQDSILAARPEYTEFFRELCRELDAEGRLRVLGLCAGDRALAVTCDILAGDGAFGFRMAFDETLHRYSPGIQLQLESIRRFHETEGINWIDSCSDPRNATLNRLWPDRRSVTTIVIGRRQWMRLARPVLESARYVRNRRLGS